MVPVQEPGHHLCFEVKDTRPGISPAQQAHLSDSFEQADRSLTRRHGGTEEAIARVRSERFDLVLMDMQMPHVDGLEATRAVRADMNTLPIVAMTANAFVSDRHACLQAGMDDHVAKPVDPMVLYATLLRWLLAQANASVGLAGSS